ncbi:EamA family transporter [Actinomadura rubrisoli]|uniref:EamA family transporter n=1 Tax=Actinomadura rubrisoli TaxID=2530368 RepID=A0A4R5AP54_9ACTN|nr:EamA family transporter [Actinomadura rubrisoli]TDD73905.1 EamA family transporter [Actinomadura rubrisoli]
MTIALAVIFAGVLHATWNAIAKGAADHWASFAFIGLGQMLVVVPLMAVTGPPAAAAWPWLGLSVAVHVVYLGLLLKSYQLGDFGQMYPLARGSAPLLVALVAALALHERPSWIQVAGVVVICGGLSVLAFTGCGTAERAGGPGGEGPAREPRAVVAALLTGASIASYTLVDGVGVRAAEGTVPYAVWLFGIEAPLTVMIILALRGTGTVTRLDRRQQAAGLTGGLISMAAYGIVLWAQTRGTLATVAALRETGVVSGAVIGAVFFSERLGPRRIAAACVVAAGAILLTAH